MKLQAKPRASRIRRTDVTTEDLVSQFLAEYPQLLKDAAKELKRRYDQADYPQSRPWPPKIRRHRQNRVESRTFGTCRNDGGEECTRTPKS